MAGWIDGAKQKALETWCFSIDVAKGRVGDRNRKWLGRSEERRME